MHTSFQTRIFGNEEITMFNEVFVKVRTLKNVVHKLYVDTMHQKRQPDMGAIESLSKMLLSDDRNNCALTQQRDSVPPSFATETSILSLCSEHSLQNVSICRCRSDRHAQTDRLEYAACLRYAHTPWKMGGSEGDT